MQKYANLEPHKDEILRTMQGLDSFDTRRRAINELVFLYYKYVEYPEKKMQLYAEAQRTAMFKRWIKPYQRCGNCKAKVLKYFEEWKQSLTTS